MLRPILILAGVGIVALGIGIRAVGGERAPEVHVGVVSDAPIRNTILASGTIVYDRQAQLSPEVIGKVVSISVRAGDFVQEGQVVLTIDDRTYRADLARQESILASRSLDVDRARLDEQMAAQRLNRAEDLKARGFISQAAFEDLDFAHKAAAVSWQQSLALRRQAEAELTQAEERLSRTVIRSPMAGQVLSVDIKEGETTVPSNQGIAGSVLMTIADLNTIRARIAVDEASVGQVRSGQAVDLFPASEPDRSLRGRVERIELTPVRSAAGGSTSRAYAAEVSVEDPNGLLKPGLTTRAEIVVSAAERALSVPVSAIIPSESVNQSHVFLLSRGRLQQRTVRLGESDDTRQQVFGRIAAGDRVVIGPPRIVRSLRDGDAVVLAEGS